LKIQMSPDGPVDARCTELTPKYYVWLPDDGHCV
jgi:hypothetical protein